MNEKTNSVLEKEHDRIGNIADKHDYSIGFDGLLTLLRFKKIKALIEKDSRILELGPAEGHMTKQILKISDNLTVMEASELYIIILKNRFPKINTIYSLFEKAELEEKFDVILILHVLEHVVNPVDLLRKAKNWLKKDGIIIITVPNANSLHRMLGVEMGILDEVHELSESDRLIGHRRVFDFDLLEKDIVNSGLKVKIKKGIFLKPFANTQMASLNKNQIEGLLKLGDKFTDNCAELMFVCTQQKGKKC